MSSGKHNSDSFATPARLAALAELTHHRWSLPIVSSCDKSPLGGHKYITFIHRLGISRDSLGRTLASLIEQGWLMNNPGVQHALRPEYVLTQPGRRVGPAATTIIKELQRLDEEQLGLQKWTLPMIAALAQGPRRFGDLRALLPGASPRAVSLALREMEDTNMIKRDVRDTYPPSADYSLSRRSLRLAAAVRRLIREIGLRARPVQKDPSLSEQKRKSA